MNKTAIKNFAIWARRELIEKVTKKAKIYGIEKDKEMKEMDTALNGQVLTSDDKKARKILIEKIDKDGFDETIEEVAYTWFNRFIAIRFMEVNGYIPSHIRVFTSENNEFEPQILSEAIHIDLPGLDKSKVLELYNAGNKEEELFNYLFITQCNALNEVLPGMFQKLNDYTELLLLDGLLRDGSVIDVMIKEIPEEDWKEQVQIIGWLYQYYNEEIKAEVINVTKRKSIEKKDIPAATQIFTTDWVVRYIVDNSLGKYWIERNPDSNLKDKLEFFIMSKNGEMEYNEEKIDPRDLRILDNCVGSGHFLLYEFDVLMEIYKECGYREREAAEHILSDNLYGLDIDERARQLAYFSLMMKVRSYSRRILNKGIEPHVYAVPDSNNLDRKFFKMFGNSLIPEEKEEARQSIEKLLSTFKDGKNYGSILKVEKVDFELCRKYIEDIDIGQLDLFTYNYREFQKEIKNIIDVAEVMTIKYDVVATNPPYLNRMNGQLKEYVNKNYKDYKTDLFSVFMYRNFDLCKPNGYSGFMTPNVWMFIKSYEELRKFIVENKSIDSLIQIAKGAFFQEATVDVIAFVFKNSTSNTPGKYIRLEEFKGGMEIQKEKVLEAIKDPDCGYFYEKSKDDFSKIPGIPIAYWASDNIIKGFETGTLMEEILDVKQGLATANNARFLRLWYEVNQEQCKFDSKNAEDLIASRKKWIPYNKGGQRRQWYGNYDYLVNWENDGFDIKHFTDSNGKQRSVVRSPEYHFKEAITWSDINSGKFAIRYRMPGGIHDVKGMSAFYAGKENLKYILGLMGSPISNYIFKMLNPTISLQVGDFKNFPVIKVDALMEKKVMNVSNENIYLSKQDWDMHETSWDFEKSPLLSNKVDGRVETAYESYKSEVNERFTKLKENEEELNRIFIGMYNLEDELTPEVSDRDITVAKIFDSKKDIDDEIKGNKYVMTREDVVKNFLSYFIGCAMGRYSLDEEGLVFAGGEFDFSKYTIFKADGDGILPITDQEYFEDDIVELFVKFLKITFGEEHLNENLDFIASELKGKKSDSSRERIRNYFLNDFYKDHCKMYQKLPIYWQYDSGKNDACRGLFYLHRYDKDMFARIRINYVFEVQDRYKQELTRIEDRIAESSGSQKIELQKRADVLKKKIIESQQFEEKVQHIADSYIEIDLDDGVKENYKIFKDVLAKIK
jgi:hypothetical protein